MTDVSEPFNLREELARIDRQRAEIHKLFEEADKRNAEYAKWGPVVRWLPLAVWVNALISLASLLIALFKH